MLEAAKTINLAVAFVLELAALAACGYWGWHAGGSPAARLVFAIVLPASVALIWGLFAAPRARFDLPTPVVLVVKVLVFALATLALVAAEAPVVAIVFAGAVAINLALLVLWDQRSEVGSRSLTS